MPQDRIDDEYGGGEGAMPAGASARPLTRCFGAIRAEPLVAGYVESEGARSAVERRIDAAAREVVGSRPAHDSGAVVVDARLGRVVRRTDFL